MKLFKKDELSLLWPFYLDALLSPMLFFMPAFGVVYFTNLGFSLFQVGVFTAFMPLFRMLFEIPTGAIADLYGRKVSVLLSTILEALGIISIFFLDNFYLMLVSSAVIGVGSSLRSGAEEAWIIDLIKSKKKDFFHTFFVKRSSLDSFGLIIAGFFGAFLVKIFGLSIVWIFGGLSFLVSAILLSFASEHFTKQKIKIKFLFDQTNKQAIKSINYSRNNPVLFRLFFATFMMVFAIAFSEDLGWITFLKDLRIPDYAFGYLLSAHGIMGVFAPIISSKLVKKGKERKFLRNITLLISTVILLTVFAFNATIAILILLSLYFFIAMRTPAERVYLHRFIPSKLRATICSVESILIAISGITAILISGLSIDIIGAKYTIIISAILIIPVVIIYHKIKEK
ncbi:MFS transporter [Candidatus Woesearchaeota archaeon]|nr:MFS transporter [Candidatus Woesearchaeota archaeon]